MGRGSYTERSRVGARRVAGVATPYLTHWARVRSAVVWDVLERSLPAGPLDVVDAGGGTGGFAVPLARLGHRVTVVDPSPDSLAALEQRAAEDGLAEPGPTGTLRGIQGDLATLPDAVGLAAADLVLCHNVLEVVDDPDAGLAALAAVLRPGGLASVLVASRTGGVMAKVLAGQFVEAQAALDRRWDRRELLDRLATAGLAPVETSGVRVFTDLVEGGLLDTDPLAFEQLVALELAVAGREPWPDLAAQLHVLARR
jgi:S-adenosylmethionine-dependent methyltransferase